MTVDELADRMSLAELQRWQEFARLEPLPADRHELLVGMQTAALVNMQLSRKSKPFEASDFTPVLQRLAEDARVAAAVASQAVEDEDEALLMRLVVGAGGSLE